MTNLIAALNPVALSFGGFGDPLVWCHHSGRDTCCHGIGYERGREKDWIRTLSST